VVRAGEEFLAVVGHPEQHEQRQWDGVVPRPREVRLVPLRGYGGRRRRPRRRARCGR
jgi:hypothetical protein